MKREPHSIATAGELVDRVTDLVSLPDIYLRVQQLLEDSDSSLADVGRIISTDPALAARLLKIANSPFFGMTAKIETISRAITILGTRQLHDLLLASSVASAFRDAPAHLDMNRFWTRSVRCAVTARLLAFECNVLDSERLFVAGLLHDIGHLVMYRMLPEPSAEAAACAEAQGQPLAEVERELFFGFDYAEVGGALLQRWRIPVMLQECVAHQNDPQQAQKFCFESSIVHCATVISAAFANNEKPVDALGRMTPFAIRQTGINETRIERIETRIMQHLADTLAVLVPGMRLAS
ncbi:MAG: HDOD domain-containing protein [Thiogranum sp.]|nr:HDOD domain-containing protein [Thiogranum sp.]